MGQYRVSGLDLSTRTALALEMLKPIPEREWGWARETADRYGVSRTLLYKIRDRAQAGMVAALEAGEAGRPAEQHLLQVDRSLIERAIAVLPMINGSVRGIQTGLHLLLGVRRSVGYVSQVLQEAGAKAELHNGQISVPLAVLGEVDEIFQGRQPCLTVVDGRSFLVLKLTPADGRDATTWGVTLLELQDQGIEFHDLASDGARGILAGIREAQLAVPLRPDLFHLLQDAHRLGQRLERKAYQALERAERARRVEQEAQANKRRQGRPLTSQVPRAQAEAEEAQALSTLDLWNWLIGEIRQALEPITPEGHLVVVSHVQTTAQTAIDLLKELNHPDVTQFADKLLANLEALVAPLQWLEEQLAPWRTDLDLASEQLILWAWQNRQALHLTTVDDTLATLHPAAPAFWQVLSLFHRSSSLAESLHSWLRPFLQIHRGMPQWLLPLLQLYWNYHTFSRGKRTGSSPLQLAAVDHVPSLSRIIDQLFGPLIAAPPA